PKVLEREVCSQLGLTLQLVALGGVLLEFGLCNIGNVVRLQLCAGFSEVSEFLFSKSAEVIPVDLGRGGCSLEHFLQGIFNVHCVGPPRPALRFLDSSW